jgi:hypothetical protein
MTWTEPPPVVPVHLPVATSPPLVTAPGPGGEGALGAGELDHEPDAVEVVRRRRSPRWWAIRISLAITMIAVDAAVLIFVLARYQPVETAGTPTGPFPGVAQPAGAHMVNDFGGVPGQLYVPPQLASFRISATIENVGSHSVAVRAIELYAPGTTIRWPLLPAGPVQFRLDGSPATLPTWTFKGSVELSPRESLTLSLPVRFADTCFLRGAFSTVAEIWVEERWLWFTHWVQVPIVPVLVEDPEPNPGPLAPSGVVRPTCLSAGAARR